MEAPGGGSLTARVVGDIRELTRSSFGQIWVCPWYPSCSEEPTVWHCSCSHKVGELSRQQRVLQIAGLLRAEFDSRARARAEAEERDVRMSRSLRRRAWAQAEARALAKAGAKAGAQKPQVRTQRWKVSGPY